MNDVGPENISFGPLRTLRSAYVGNESVSFALSVRKKLPKFPFFNLPGKSSPHTLDTHSLKAALRRTTMKKAHLITISVFCLLIALPLGLFVRARGNAQSPEPDTSYRLSGPYTHNNLTVFLVHGKDQTTRTFLTLQEALAQKKVRVYETKEVNELAIRNFSNENIYVQAGDIVRGGEQDRMISIDFIVPPRSGRMPIAAFCVESGRWNKRGNEEAAVFASSENGVVSKEIKLAAKSAKSQQEVWKTVKVAQDKLGRNVGGSVQDQMSVSSLELSVEDRKVKETTAAYIKALSGILQNKSDVIGYVFAINGKVNSADIYASHALFAKLWPKLIKASSVEAVAEIQKGLEHKPVTDETVKAFLVESEQASASTKDVTPHVRLVTREDDKNAFYETQDRSQKDGFVHRNYIRKQ